MPGHNLQFSPRTFRLGLILGLCMYGVFGILDWFMLPGNYTSVWLLRYAVITPFIIIAFFLSCYRNIFIYKNIWLLVLLSSGQLGIVAMIAISQPGEPAFFTYYAGLILIILWAAFVFMLSFWFTVYVALSTIVLYNFTAVFIQGYFRNNHATDSFPFLINNNFFLCSAAILAVIGAYQLAQYRRKNLEIYSVLQKDKSELEKAKNIAEEGIRLKNAFLQNMSHEIRTPMNAISGFAALMGKPGLTPEKRERYISIIQGSSKQLLAIVNDILTISAIDTGQEKPTLEKVDLIQVMDELHAIFAEQAAGTHVEVTAAYDVPAAHSEILTDRVKLIQILTNLLGNALKFTPKGRVEFGFRMQNDMMEFFVRDTGIGISAEHREIIFERFRQADFSISNRYGGAGLGLSISRGFVEMLGGKIWVGSHPGKGSVFWFTIPRIPVT